MVVPECWVFASHVEIEAETAYAAFLSAEAPEADGYFRAGISAYRGPIRRGLGGRPDQGKEIAIPFVGNARELEDRSTLASCLRTQGAR